jgi:ribosomal protein S27E
MQSMTSRLMRALRRRGRPRSLVDCEHCGRDFVVPVAWVDLDEERWWVRVRCGECGRGREVVLDNEEARRYEAHVDRGTREIARSLSRVRRQGSESPAG